MSIYVYNGTLYEQAIVSNASTLQRTNTENLKQIFPKKELRGHSPNFQIHVSVRDLYVYSHDLSAYSAVGNMWTNPGNIYTARRPMNVEIRTEAVQFPEKEYIKGIFVAM